MVADNEIFILAANGVFNVDTKCNTQRPCAISERTAEATIVIAIDIAKK